MKALLLNNAYQGLEFISWKKAIHHVVKGSVEVIENWDEEIRYGTGTIPYPAILRLKKYRPRHIKKMVFQKSLIFKRDKNTCQYCNKTLNIRDLTVDHVYPRTLCKKDNIQANTWENCVAACNPCNNKKGEKLLKDCDMKLLHKPFAPKLTIWHEYRTQDPKHPAWSDYVVGQ